MFTFLTNAQIFSKFDLKLGFWQLGIEPSERYKTAFLYSKCSFSMDSSTLRPQNCPIHFSNWCMGSLSLDWIGGWDKGGAGGDAGVYPGDCWPGIVVEDG